MPSWNYPENCLRFIGLGCLLGLKWFISGQCFCNMVQLKDKFFCHFSLICLFDFITCRTVCELLIDWKQSDGKIAHVEFVCFSLLLILFRIVHFCNNTEMKSAWTPDTVERERIRIKIALMVCCLISRNQLLLQMLVFMLLDAHSHVYLEFCDTVQLIWYISVCMDSEQMSPVHNNSHVIKKKRHVIQVSKNNKPLYTDVLGESSGIPNTSLMFWLCCSLHLYRQI